MKQFFLKKSELQKAIVGVFIFLCSTGLLSAQTNSSWTLQSETNGVKLYYKLETCATSNMMFFKLENTNSVASHVNYNIVIESTGHNMPLLPQFVELAANETKEGSCSANVQLTTDIKNITNPSLLVVMNVN